MPWDDDLLLRETHHRCSNDLQLVVGLLGLQSRRATNAEARAALNDAMERVAVLVRARSTLNRREQSIESALRQVCEALQSQAEPRGILVSLAVDPGPHRLSASTIMTVALAINELATNAIKHGFKDGRTGSVRVTLRHHDRHQLTVLVDDDGLPFPDATEGRGAGSGLGLVRRLIAATGGLMIVPEDGSKRFELRVPAAAD